MRLGDGGNRRKGRRRTLVIGSPAKEMRFVPQRQTDSVVILSSEEIRIELLVLKTAQILLNFKVLLARMNQEIFELVNSR